MVLVGPIGTRLKSLLPDDVITPTHTIESNDEVHIILEYSAGSQWGEVRSSCANRIIISHDVSNSNMVALEFVRDTVQQFTPDLVVLSGAHLLEGLDKKVWKQHLNTIGELLDYTLDSIPVHWELATIGNLEFFHELANILFPRVNSLGLNEQELLSVAKSCNAPFDFNDVPQKPGIDWVSDLLHWLMLTYSSESNTTRMSSLTRVHMHSLSFHLIATVERGPWFHNKEAVMAGARVAGLQACNIDTFSPNNFTVLHPKEFYVSRSDVVPIMLPKSGWIHWSRDNINYHFSPVLVCINPTKTVGLGDAISALGLIYSRYNV